MNSCCHTLYFLTFYFLSCCLDLQAQKPLPLNYLNNIIEINTCFDSIRPAPTDSMRFAINQRMAVKIEKMLLPAESFSPQPDSLKRIGHLLSPDNAFRIITWNVPLTNGTNRYFGFIQLNPRKDSICKLFSLNDVSYTYKNRPLSETMHAHNWFGALYYQIIPVKSNGTKVYTLLATRFNDLFTTQKVLESLYFDDDGTPIFGTPIFEHGLKPEKRVIYEYSINAVMSMKYFDNLKMIVLDHLAPPSALYNGIYKFYGPDFSFDGYKFEKNMWRFVPNVNFKKQK